MDPARLWNLGEHHLLLINYWQRDHIMTDPASRYFIFHENRPLDTIAPVPSMNAQYFRSEVVRDSTIPVPVSSVRHGSYRTLDAQTVRQTTKACDLCRARKRKCDWEAEQNTCSGCRRLGVACQFAYVRKQRPISRRWVENRLTLDHTINDGFLGSAWKPLNKDSST